MVPVSTNNRTSVAGDGTEDVFSTDFTVYETSHLEVYLDGVLQTSGFAVALFANGTYSSIAKVTFTTAPASGVLVLLVRNVPFSQNKDYANNAVLDVENIERSLDILTFQTQQLNTEVDRSLTFSDTLSGDTGFETTASAATTITANKAARINKGLMFDADGNITVTEDNPNEQVTLAEIQVGLAEDQVTLAGDEVGLAEDQVELAEDQVALATSWATKVDGAVSGSDFSAKAHASVTGTHAPAEGSAKEWAVTAEDTPVTTGPDTFSALHHSAKAEDQVGLAADQVTLAADQVTLATDQKTLAIAQAEAAANSAAAVSASFDSFDDRYLGVMLDTGTSATVSTTGTWDAASSSITVASATGIIIGQKLTTVASGYPTSANVISVTGSVVVISEPFTVAGAATAVQFIGYGVYGDFSGVTDGPDKDNDGVTLGALHKGLLYFNSTDREMRVFDGSVWLAASSAGSSSMVVHKYISDDTSPTSVLSASFSPVLSYSATNVIVFLNGVSLIDTTDYVATNGSDITGLAALAEDDELVVVAFKSFEVANVEGTSIKSTGETDTAKYLRVDGAGASWQSPTGTAIAMALIFG